MHTRFKVIIGVAVACVIAFFAAKSCHAQATLQVLNKLSQGYELRVIGDNIVAWNACDTITVPKSNYTDKELKQMRQVYALWQRSKKQLTVQISDTFDRIPINTYIPDRQRVYFVASESVLQTAIQNGTLKGLLADKVLRSRRSLTQAGGDYYRVVEIYVDYEDSVIIKNSEASGQIHYLVPYTCTMDSLRGYLNDLNSVPVWTTLDSP
jgi:hypothetical protein